MILNYDYCIIIIIIIIIISYFLENNNLCLTNLNHRPNLQAKSKLHLLVDSVYKYLLLHKFVTLRNGLK
jgi:hypothetical protein